MFYVGVKMDVETIKKKYPRAFKQNKFNIRRYFSDIAEKQDEDERRFSEAFGIGDYKEAMSNEDYLELKRNK